MSTATLNGKTCTKARVALPAWGVWWAEVELAEEHTLTGSLTLQIADLTLVGARVSGRASGGRSAYRLAGGAASWGVTVPAKSYSNDAGVKLATVLQDAASAAGETLDAATIPTSTIGPSYSRELAPASRVLEQLSPQAWYVGADGVTRIGKRSGAALTGATVGPIDEARDTVEVAADAIAAILPGVTVDGREVVDVEHSVSADAGLRSRLWFAAGGASTSRAARAFRRMVEASLPRIRFLGAYEYRIVTLEGERLNLQPVRVAAGMPDLRRVRAWPGASGVRATPALGSRVLVTWVDGDPARPVVVAYEDAEGEGFAPDRLDLVGEDDAAVTVGEAAGRVVRYGDSIVFPVGAGATPTEMPVAILTPQSLSRVRA